MGGVEQKLALAVLQQTHNLAERVNAAATLRLSRLAGELDASGGSAPTQATLDRTLQEARDVLRHMQAGGGALLTGRPLAVLRPITPPITVSGSVTKACPQRGVAPAPGKQRKWAGRESESRVRAPSWDTSTRRRSAA